MPCQSIVVPRVGFRLFGFQFADERDRQACILQAFENWVRDHGVPPDDVQVVLTWPSGSSIESTQGWEFLRDWAAVSYKTTAIEFRLTPGVPVENIPAVRASVNDRQMDFSSWYWAVPKEGFVLSDIKAEGREGMIQAAFNLWVQRYGVPDWPAPEVEVYWREHHGAHYRVSCRANWDDLIPWAKSFKKATRVEMRLVAGVPVRQADVETPGEVSRYEREDVL